MNIVKKFAALISAAILILRLITLNVFALSAAPVLASSELAALLGYLIVGAGICTADQIKDMTCDEMKDKLRPIVSSGTLPTDTPDAMTNLRSTLYNLITSPAGIVSSSVGQSLLNSSVCNWLSELTGAHIVPTFGSVDMKGMGCLAIFKFTGSSDYRRFERYFYGDFGVIGDTNLSHGFVVKSNENPVCYVVDYVYDKYSGELLESYELDHNNRVQYAGLSQYGYFDIVLSTDYYGDWRYADGSKAETSDTTVPAIGEADGTTVTPDMLNPDGSVTINDITYYPKDYIDMDKFDDTAILDLLGEILDKIDNTTVVVQNNDTVQDMVGEVSVELDIGELNNFKMPVGIADVFPFCLPFDFVRGFKGLVSKPEIPVFKSELDLTDFCGYNLGKHTIEISLEKWEPAVVIFRWFSLILFSYSLILLTGKIVKGAGA